MSQTKNRSSSESNASPKTSPIGQASEKPRHSTDYSEVMRKFPPTKNGLAAFMVRPKDVRMDIQHHDEKILLVLRSHPITNLRWIFFSLIMILAPLLLYLLPVQTFFPANISLAAMILWYLLTFGIILENILSWYYNINVITDERIVDVDFHHITYKNISTTKIDNIQDITVQMGGALRSMLNFGTVHIQTAGTQNEFEFEDVPNPKQVSKLLNELIIEEELEKHERRAF